MMDCIECGSQRVQFNDDFGYYECLNCGKVWSEDEDDPDYDEEPPIDLGPCCACLQEKPLVRNLLSLHKQTFIPGTGWGCFVCNLPSDGAMAVICDECLESKAPLKQVIYGNAAEKQRRSYEELAQQPDFDHNLAFHQTEIPQFGRLKIPDFYRPPYGLPLNWQDETTGQLPAAVEAYINFAACPLATPPTPTQMNLVIDYFKHYISAPCWEATEELSLLRDMVNRLESFSDIKNWLDLCLEIGLDPL